MRDDICTIPISEVFEISDGCPICRMRNTIEDRIVEYIMGAAMMESDVRQETNRIGFCETHFKAMLSKRGRLSLALILDSHLDYIKQLMFEKKGFFSTSLTKKTANSNKLLDSCFVCEKIEWGQSRQIDTLFRLYETEKEFRALFDNQPKFCLPHYNLLLTGCDKRVMKSHHNDFINSLDNITLNYLNELTTDIKHYCKMYDYRNNTEDADWGNSKDSIERSVEFLTSRNIQR